MIKQEIKLCAFAITLIVFSLPSCKKTCYQCYQLGANFRCIKGLDTIIVGAVNPKPVNDTLQLYQSQGYNCDTLYFLWQRINYSDPTDLVCSKTEYEEKLRMGENCVVAH